ncbi:MAG: DUF1631 family protein [Pseudohongiellaceae bacterium]
MSVVTATGGHSRPAPADTVLLEKVRWSLRQRLRKQMSLLSCDFFDELDDFLFSAGRGGQLAAEGGYLNAMRELRARKSLFEEQLLEKTLATVKESYRQDPVALQQSLGSIAYRDAAVYESVEIDLALQAMARKADKAYFPVIKQIDALQSRHELTGSSQLLAPRILLAATLAAFREAQSVFTLGLEVRLLFIKLFEQHFLLKLEKAFVDMVSIIHNMNDPVFVEKLYSSSSAFRKQQVNSDKTVVENRSLPPEQPADNRAALVKSNVDQLIAAICDDKSMPAFLEDMVRKQWREVIFLIGLHKGTTSLEWSEARHSVSLLVTAAVEQLYLEDADYQSIKEHLRHGFSLIQLGWSQQEAFFQNLADHFQTFAQHLEQGSTTATRYNKNGLEASISPSGEELLNQDDLDEIAKLLGVDDDEQPKQLDDYLEDVDQLQDQAMVDFMLNGAYVNCLLTRSHAQPGQYTISKRGARISVTRSRLGLALALQSGELRLCELQRPPATQHVVAHTILETSSRTRH